MKYSPSTGGFYPDDFPEDALPGDCAQVSDDAYHALIAAQAQGKVIVAGDGGQPQAVDPVLPAPTLAEQAATLLADGIAITSTGTPALNGTYACDGTTYQEILTEMVSILSTEAFADGETTIAWPDIEGVPHTFGIDGFKALAGKIGAFAQPLLRIIRTGSGDLPPATATIT